MEFTKKIHLSLELSPDEVEALRIALEQGKESIGRALFKGLSNEDWEFIEDLLVVLN